MRLHLHLIYADYIPFVCLRMSPNSVFDVAISFNAEAQINVSIYNKVNFIILASKSDHVSIIKFLYMY